jgi:excinuclease ABC subunit B
MHSDIDTLERIEIIRDLRLGKFDVLVGINLLREGLDIPECAFVGILDADKEGFLRSETSLVQTIGRAARNSEARVVLYGDRVTGSMQRAIDETDRRRARQVQHNELNNITPKTVLRGVADTVGDSQDAQRIKDEANRFTPTGQIKKKFIENSSDFKRGDNIITVMANIEKQMFKAAENLEFEKAAELRDELERLKSNS